MTRVLLYEFACSGGLWSTAELPISDSILSEGRAMLLALAADFAAQPDVTVQVLRDRRVSLPLPPNVQQLEVPSAAADADRLATHAATADWTVVIAPEFDELLRKRSRTVEQAGGRLLGPDSALITQAGDKQRTADLLAERGIPCPAGFSIFWPNELAQHSLTGPVVVKPRFGAGSQQMRLLRSPDDLRYLADPPWQPQQSLRIESFIPGTACSVAFLCGPAGNWPLPPCRQRLSEAGDFAYFGGSLPLPPDLSRRALELATRAVSALPFTYGYIGVDLVLSDNPQLVPDCVIEINPRLTTSYIGLRRALRENLAGLMLQVAAGKKPDLTMRPNSVEFDSDGDVRCQGNESPPAA
ncbi:MAG: ATP-grasp domain-containing protein [Planctomycetota bacterium]|nr:ATP-grasp domain-containing protein [Planctomycetota bacterium]